MRSIRALVLAAAALSLGCSSDTLTRPATPRIVSHRANDRAATSGNPYFSFLQPIAAPRADAMAGAFDGTLSPVVKISAGGTTVATLTTSSAGAERVRVEDGYYIANWKTPRDASGSYRIQVFVGPGSLGYADVDLSKKGSFSPGSTIPVKFRIDVGALDISVAPIGTSGGTIQSTDGALKLDIPAGALGSELQITAEKLNAPTDPDGRLIPGTAFDFGPDGTQFSTPVTIAVTFDPATIPSGLSPSLLRLFTLVGGAWQILPGSTVDLSTHTVTGQTTHFSTYAVLPAKFTMVAAGEYHACGLTEAGTAWCWGRNSAQQLGAPTTETCPLTNVQTGVVTNVPCSRAAVEVQGGLSFTNVEAATNHSCGVTAAHEIWCWGSNAFGQLGDGSTTSSMAPVKVASSEQFVAVSAENTISCGLTSDGSVFCWGSDQQLALGSAVSTTCAITSTTGVVSNLPCSPTPLRVNIPAAAQVDVGLQHGCARTTAGDVYCWGWNAFGQIGNGVNGTTQTGVLPVKVGSGFDNVSAGAIHTCALKSGISYCWGTNFNTGALGDGLAAPHFTPQPVAGSFVFKSVDASNGNYIYTHSCGVTTSGAAVCWGANFDGALGVATAPQTCNLSNRGFYDCALSPIAVETALTFGQVTTGRGFTCGYSTTGDVYCWGLNDFGNLGNGTTTRTRSPVKVLTAP